MNYRGLIFSLIGLVGVILGIVFAVRGLHRKDEAPKVKTPERAIEDCHFPLLRAVPSDAAVILSFDGGKDAAWYLTDSASVFPTLLGEKNLRQRARFLRAASGKKMAVSLHDAGSLTPLYILDISAADSSALASLSAQADTAGLRTKLFKDGGVMLASSSETLLGTSERHLSGEISVLKNRELLAATAALPYGNAIFLSHAAASRIIRTFLSREYLTYASFLSKAAVWTGFSLPGKGKSEAEGYSVAYDNTGYQSLFAGMTPGEFHFREILPSEAISVMAIATDKPGTYLALRRKWVDACGRLSAYKESCSGAKKTLGKAADDYLTDFDLREVASVMLPSGERAVALRYGKKLPDGRDLKIYGAGYALEMLLGEQFRPQGDTLWSTVRGEWKLIGTRSALTVVSESKPLKDVAVTDNLIPAGGVFVLYNAGNAPAQVLADAFAIFARKRFGAFPRVASSFSATPSDGGVRYTIRHKGVQTAPQRVAKPSAVGSTQDSAPVPEAAPSAMEYRVRNFQTGRMNVFFQNPDNSIGLRDDAGRTLWTIPFNLPICGRVQEIDYYGTGKIQYLFAAGSRLYVIDRLGRFLPSFDVDLRKDILIGPDLYGFTDDNYDVMVLHEDNSLSLYTLDGARFPGWKDISPRETIQSLPELLTIGDEQYWKVTLSSGERYYRFGGGAPLSARKTRKLLKRNRTTT
ncbi:MAG: hypothetical protein IKX37_00875 [Bacteroidales bacterium]|nr:hypothetical protein [Bacteroidales bacterium]